MRGLNPKNPFSCNSYCGAFSDSSKAIWALYHGLNIVGHGCILFKVYKLWPLKLFLHVVGKPNFSWTYKIKGSIVTDSSFFKMGNFEIDQFHEMFSHIFRAKIQDWTLANMLSFTELLLIFYRLHCIIKRNRMDR